MFFCCSIYIKTAQNSREKCNEFTDLFVLKTIIMLFKRLLSCDTHNVYITTRNIFLIPDDAVARNLTIVYNFSSQRPRLNYLFLSNVYSFDTIEFSMKHKY